MKQINYIVVKQIEGLSLIGEVLDHRKLDDMKITKIFIQYQNDTFEYTTDPDLILKLIPSRLQKENEIRSALVCKNLEAV